MQALGSNCIGTLEKKVEPLSQFMALACLCLFSATATAAGAAAALFAIN